MEQSKAKSWIIVEWRKWKAENIPDKERPTTTDGLSFFVDLQAERPDLLDFEYQGDKWQIVHAWLLEHRLVVD